MELPKLVKERGKLVIITGKTSVLLLYMFSIEQSIDSLGNVQEFDMIYDLPKRI